ncbi:MAG TPA: retroviral-like aspartic protease family protein [Steroidobacteraceae bacterium]|jgi:predicted aspartyl protease|nr:retroviral-like aspartic protease family protein [Steroidobacteraceae bacterium]
MRAMLGFWCLQCLLLTSAAQATALPLAPGTLTTGAQTAATPTAGAAAPQPLSPQDLLFACPTSLDHIGRVVAAVMVDGKGPFRFIIDTGANRSTISPHLAAVLGLQPSVQQAMRVIGITGTADVASVAVERLQAGDLVISHSRLPIIEAPIMAGADGILGAAGLQDERLLVDFRHNKVVITRSRGDSVPWGFTRVGATQLKDGLLSIPGEVGGVRVEAVIDTGSQHTLGNQALYQALYAHERGKGTYLATDVYGATKQVGTGRLQLAPDIDLGALKIGGVALVFGDFHIFKVWGMTDRPAMVLGMDVLGTVNAFAIDFRHPELAIDSRYDYDSAMRAAPACRLPLDSRSTHCSG